MGLRYTSGPTRCPGTRKSSTSRSGCLVSHPKDLVPQSVVPLATSHLSGPIIFRQGSELAPSSISCASSPWDRCSVSCVSAGGLQGTGRPSQYLPMGWIASLLPLVPIPTGGFSVISPQTAGVLKSRTASRAAGVGARDHELGGGRGWDLEFTQLDA